MPAANEGGGTVLSPPAPPPSPPPGRRRSRRASEGWALGAKFFARTPASGRAGPPTRPPSETASPTLFGRGVRFLRSAGVQLAAVYALLFGLSALVLVVFLWWATAGLLQRQVEAAIRADAQGLTERWEEGGAGALEATIEDRLAENVDDNAIYLLVDADGRRMAGNLAAWPASVAQPDVWYDMPVERAGTRGTARLRRFDLPGGRRLLVGRDVRTDAALRDILTDAMLWMFGLALVLGTTGAVLVQRLFRRMLARVSVTAGAISGGDLGQRVALSGRGDEFDRLAETINDMLDRIARLMDGVRQVSNAIAHDLRTPITRARARLEETAQAQDAAVLRAGIDRAVSDLDNVTAVFQALLRIAEIEAGARRSAFAPLDAAPMLEDVGELYGALAEESGLHLQIAAPGPLRLNGDRDLLQQAVANLLDNAIKFSPPAGVIRLDAWRTPGIVGIAVADQGPGIPQEERAYAAERFFRGEQARSTPGSGLGLSLVQAVAQLHGGVLRLEDAAPGLRAVLILSASPDVARGPQ